MSKEFESWEEIKDEMLEWTEGYEENFDIIEKSLKALEIINKKLVNIYIIKDLKCTLADYNTIIINEKCHLTQEEFDLLKEVLL